MPLDKTDHAFTAQNCTLKMEQEFSQNQCGMISALDQCWVCVPSLIALKTRGPQAARGTAVGADRAIDRLHQQGQVSPIHFPRGLSYQASESAGLRAGSLTCAQVNLTSNWHYFRRRSPCRYRPPSRRVPAWWIFPRRQSRAGSCKCRSAPCRCRRL